MAFSRREGDGDVAKSLRDTMDGLPDGRGVSSGLVGVYNLLR